MKDLADVGNNEHTSLTACCAASRFVNVIKAYPLLVPDMGSIISLKSHILPHFSNKGINSSSYMSLGIFPQNTCTKMINIINYALILYN